MEKEVFQSRLNCLNTMKSKKLKENEPHLPHFSVPYHYGVLLYLGKAMQMFVQVLAQRQSLCSRIAFLSAINVSLSFRFVVEVCFWLCCYLSYGV